MSAYNYNYLDNAMNNLGEAFDYAIYICNIKPDDFAHLFVASGLADYYGKGNPKYVVGMSGTELAMYIIESTGGDLIFPKAQIEYDCSPEYWTGWMLAYYQWKSGRTFRDILNNISILDLLKLYPTLHEASEDKSVDTIDSIILRKNNPTKLQQQRKKYGYSQRELAKRTGVNIRTLQQYESGSKDIKKAAASTVLTLANALGCSIEDIM